MIHFILLYHDPFILASSSFSLISHVTIIVLSFFTCPFTYDATFDFFMCWFSMCFCMEDSHSFPSFHPMGSDPDIFFFRGYLVSDDS